MAVRFLGKLLLFSLPFLAYGLVVAAVDPYEYFRPAAGPAAAQRARLAERVDGPLQRLIAFRRHPHSHLLLGDSRMASLPESLVSATVGEPAANLAYGGGSLNEALKTFWIADGLTGLKSVAIGVNVDLYNDSNAKDRVGPAGALIRNPGLYLYDRLVGLTAWYCVRDALSGRKSTPGRPPMSPEAFWDFQLNVTAKASLGSYRDPVGYRKRLAELAAECRQRHIRLAFLIFPEHHDLREAIRRAGLASQAEQMAEELARLGQVYDFRQQPEWTENRDRYIDPYHFREDIGAEIIRRVWGAPDSGAVGRQSVEPQSAGPQNATGLMGQR